MDGVDEPCSPTPPTGQHQHQKRTFDALQKPDIFTCSRHSTSGSRANPARTASGDRSPTQSHGPRSSRRTSPSHVRPTAGRTPVTPPSGPHLPPRSDLTRIVDPNTAKVWATK